MWCRASPSAKVSTGGGGVPASQRGASGATCAGADTLAAVSSAPASNRRKHPRSLPANPFVNKIFTSLFSSDAWLANTYAAELHSPAE
jgi:hypothetical protein